MTLVDDARAIAVARGRFGGSTGCRRLQRMKKSRPVARLGTKKAEMRLAGTPPLTGSGLARGLSR